MLEGNVPRSLALPGFVDFYELRTHQTVAGWSVGKYANDPDPPLDFAHQAFQHISRVDSPTLRAGQAMDG